MRLHSLRDRPPLAGRRRLSCRTTRGDAADPEAAILARLRTTNEAVALLDQALGGASFATVYPVYRIRWVWVSTCSRPARMPWH